MCNFNAASPVPITFKVNAGDKEGVRLKFTSDIRPSLPMNQGTNSMTLHREQ